MPDPIPGLDRETTAAASIGRVADLEPQSTGAVDPRISVIISTLNRAFSLDATIRSLLNQRYRNFEVIVVTGPCTDDTDAILQRWAQGVRRLHCAVRNLSVSRNIGLLAAAGELIAFIDDDAIPEPDWLERLAEPFRDPTVGATGGAIRNWTGIRFQSKALYLTIGGSARRTSPDALADGRLCPALTGTNFCVRRDAVVAAGLFDEAYAYFLEESDLQQVLFKAGMRLVYVDNAEVHHLRAPNLHRNRDRVPLDYQPKMRSLAYYCLKHRQPEDTRHELIVRFAWQLRFAIAETRRMVEQNRLGVTDAAALVRSAFKGFRAGIQIYAEQLDAPATCTVAAVGQPTAFKPFWPNRKIGLRIAIISRGSNQVAGAAAAHQVAEKLSRLTHEITLIEGSQDNGVAYVDAGYWAHRRTKRLADPRPFLGMNLRLALRELRRVEVNRRFDVVVDLNFGAQLVFAAVYPWQPFRNGATRALLVRAEKKSLIRVEPSQLGDQAEALATRCQDKSERRLQLDGEAASSTIGLPRSASRGASALQPG